MGNSQGGPASPERLRITVNGIVQGVGFRPFVCRLARSHLLSGFVANTPEGVIIEVEGQVGPLEGFLRVLRQEPPPLALVASLSVLQVPSAHEADFSIRDSLVSGPVATQISPDVAVCPECLAELYDPSDRRFRYPFINCTNCGPRYTIVELIPYDRANTSMRDFIMCESCRSEYADPGNRRFHAEPNCCPLCGPQLRLVSGSGILVAEGDDAVREAAFLLAAGRIVAVKGLGGFHLAVDAASSEAVSLLRQRKGREEKPLALMVPDLDAANSLCVLGREEEQALAGHRRPIVLAEKRSGHALAEEIAPGQDLFGLMLPYTPLHHLLLREGPGPLVMTSANLSEEPICAGNGEALRRLAGIADFLLLHDRDICQPCDDSVVSLQAGAIRPVRRSRGYAPQPVMLDGSGVMVLGTGAELKNTVCLLKANQAFLSQHIGDLKDLATFGFFRRSISHLREVFDVDPELIVHDLHPGFLSSRWAREQPDIPVVAVQHHHAHLAACLAENREAGPVIGIILDGVGYGSDHTVWGGEVLVGDAGGCSRFAALESLPLPGGDAAVQAPWRTALSYLSAACGEMLPPLPFLGQHDCGPVLAQIERKINAPLTSSCGRLFDAVAAMSGGRQVIHYEAQAAIELMQEAGGALGDAAFPCELYWENDILRFSVRMLIAAVAEAIMAGMAVSELSRRFHKTLVDGFTLLAVEARRREKIGTVALSGGVFQNRLLFEGLVSSLGRTGFKVLTHRELPCNDGSVSLGQAVIGRKISEGR